VRRVALLAVVAVAVGCGTSSPPSGFTTDASTGTPGTPLGDDDGGTSNPIPSFDGSLGGGGTIDAASNQIAVVYGESPDTLYSLDPVTKAVNVVGAFSGCTSVEDIALDKDSNMYGTTENALYKIDTATAACTLIAKGTYPNSLSFVPAGTLDPNVEALVGYNGSDYVRIDPTTGAVTTVGSIGSGLSSSGDIVSVIGGSTYLTVTGTGCSTNDCLIEVDPKTGALVKNWKSVGHNQVFGLSFWAGALYGFDDGGDLFEIDLTNGVLSTKTITVPNAPAGLEFWGAGSTTSAPVSPPAK
jgi:hypothetical protein